MLKVIESDSSEDLEERSSAEDEAEAGYLMFTQQNEVSKGQDGPERGNPSSNKASEKKQSDTQNSLDLSRVDFVTSNAKCSHEGTKLYIF